MSTTDKLLKSIIAGIQEKKGKKIVVADLRQIEDCICNYFIICQGNSPSHTLAITDSIKDTVRKNTGDKVSGVEGQRNAQWIVMDFGDIIVHIFLSQTREYYNLEHLWADAKLTTIEDID